MTNFVFNLILLAQPPAPVNWGDGGSSPPAYHLMALGLEESSTKNMFEWQVRALAKYHQQFCKHCVEATAKSDDKLKHCQEGLAHLWGDKEQDNVANHLCPQLYHCFAPRCWMGELFCTLQLIQCSDQILAYSPNQAQNGQELSLCTVTMTLLGGHHKEAV